MRTARRLRAHKLPHISIGAVTLSFIRTPAAATAGGRQAGFGSPADPGYSEHDRQGNSLAITSCNDKGLL